MTAELNPISLREDVLRYTRAVDEGAVKRPLILKRESLAVMNNIRVVARHVSVGEAKITTLAASDVETIFRDGDDPPLEWVNHFKQGFAHDRLSSVLD